LGVIKIIILKGDIKNMDKILGENIQTIGELKKALENIPDKTLLDIGTKEYEYEVTTIATDGVKVSIMTNNVIEFKED